MIIGFVFLGFTACEDEDLSPILTFDNAGKGAYIRLITETPRFIDLFNVAGSDYTYSVEFVDINMGADVASYDLQVTYDPESGNSIGPVTLRSFSSSEFQDLSSGFKGIENITITANDLFSAVGISEADIDVFDDFDIVGTLTDNAGNVWGASNSAPPVRGAAFRGHFDFTRSVGCASDIGGSYTSVSTMISTDGCCPDEITVNSSVTLSDNGGGVYTISDFTAGTYLENYDVYGVTAGTNTARNLTDICNEISGSFADVFSGSTINVTGSRDDATGVITYDWDNSFGDTGTVILTPQ